MEGKKRLTRAERLKKKHGLTSLSAELGGEKLPTRAEQVEKKHGLTSLAAKLGAVEPQYQAKLYERLELERRAEENLKSGKKRRSSWPFLPGGFESNSR